MSLSPAEATPREKPFFGSFFATEYGKMVPDANSTVSITVQVDGNPKQIVFNLSELASALRPKLQTHIGSLSSYRRVLRTKLPTSVPQPACEYVQRSQRAALLTSMNAMVEDFSSNVLPIVEQMGAHHLESLAQLLTRVALRRNLLCPLLRASLVVEFDAASNEQGSIMRGTSFAALVQKFFCAEGECAEFRRSIIAPFVTSLCEQPTLSLEVDPMRAPEGHDTVKATQELIRQLGLIIDAITQSVSRMPRILHYACAVLDELGAASRAELSVDQRFGLVAGFIMLRYFNPSIITPHAFGILDESFPELSAVSRKNLTLITRILQKMSTGLRFSEDYMEPVQAAMDTEYMKLKAYLKDLLVDPLGLGWSDCEAPQAKPLEPSDLPDSDFGAFFSMLEHMAPLLRGKRGFEDSLDHLADYQYLRKLQHLLADECNYIGSLEQIETDLLKISKARGFAPEDDPFSDIYLSIKNIIAWHVSIYYQLHERVSLSWHLVHKVGDVLGRILLEFEATYEEMIQEYVSIYRLLVESVVALRAKGDAIDAAVMERAEGMLTTISKPMKRLSGLLALFADGVLPLTHPDARAVSDFMSYGVQLFNHIKSRVSVNTVYDIGQVELSFEESLCLLEAGRTILRQGQMQVRNADFSLAPVDVWLFDDLFLAGQRVVAAHVELESVAVANIDEDPAWFTVASEEAPGSAVTLVCQSVRQKNLWSEAILAARKTLLESNRAHRLAAAQQMLPGMQEEDWDALVDAGTAERLQRGKGTPLSVGKKIYLLQSGQIQVLADRGHSSTVVSSLRVGECEMFGQAQLLGGVHANTGVEIALVTHTPVSLVSVSADLLRKSLTSDVGLAQRFYKSACKANALMLKKLRERDCASRTIELSTSIDVLATSRFLTALEAVQAGGSDPLTTIMQGKDEVLRWRELSWRQLIEALESDKLITKGSLSKKGVAALSDPGGTLKSASKTLKEATGLVNPMRSTFGLEFEECCAIFTQSGVAGRLYFSEHYACFVSKGLSAEKHKTIKLSCVSASELKKKSVEITYVLPGKAKQHQTKFTLKSTADASACLALFRKANDREASSKIALQIESCKQQLTQMLATCSVSFIEPGVELAASTGMDLPSLYIVEENYSVLVVGKMAQSEVLLDTLEAGSAFLPDPGFLGLPSNAKVAFKAGVEGLRARRINLSVMEDTASSAALLRWLGISQWLQIQSKLY